MYNKIMVPVDLAHVEKLGKAIGHPQPTWPSSTRSQSVSSA